LALIDPFNAEISRCHNATIQPTRKGININAAETTRKLTTNKIAR
jgi:hypothetical protein